MMKIVTKFSLKTDKLAHFAIGSVLAIIFLPLHFFGLSIVSAALITSSSVLAFAVIWELYRAYEYEFDIDLWDIAFTVAGGIFEIISLTIGKL
jgi:hypothetical protein